MRIVPIAACMLALFAPPAASAQSTTEMTSVTQDFRASTVRELADALRKQYVSGEVGEVAAAGILQKLRAGEYNSISDGNNLAAKLTQDLLELTKDKHLQVFFSAAPQQWIPPDPQNDAEQAARLEEEQRRGAMDNFGFQNAEILAGNVGYLRVTRLAPPATGAAAARAALDFLANARALIVDLRSAGGGHEDMAALLIGELTADSEGIQLLEQRFRSGEIRQLWAPAYLRHVLSDRPL